jgi:hypothetical protein
LVAVPTAVTIFVLLSSRFFSTNELVRLREDSITSLIPQAKPSEDGIGIVTSPATRWQLFQFFDVASSQNYVVGLEGCDQAGNYVRDMPAPFLLAPFL